MLKFLMRWRIDAFGRDWGYDVGYMRQILEASPRAARRFAAVQGFAHHREGVPRAASVAASLAALMAEDCGPCVQLVVRMAERAGVDPRALKAVVSHDLARMPEEMRLAFRFAEASLAHDHAADELRDEIVKRWGEKGLVSLAFAIAGARIYPTLKYALGHGQACSRVRVGDVELPVPRRAA